MPKTKKNHSSSDSDSGPEDRNPPSKKKLKGSSEVKTSSSNSGDGNNKWELEKLRLVRINEFRGKRMVDIREFYEKNGEVLPGKKGISLSATQWKKLLEIADEVTKALGD